MAEDLVDDALWEEFHALVNMSSRELRDFLTTADAGEETEALPDQAGDERSRAVLDLLGRRRTDLGPDDVVIMRSVVEEIRAGRGEEPESHAGDTAWRHWLMSRGHDPLKPSS